MDPIIRLLSRPILWLPPLLLFGVAVAFVSIFPTVAIYLVLGLLFSLLARPVFNLLRYVKVKQFSLGQGVRAFFSILFVWAGLAGITLIMIPILSDQAEKLSQVEPEQILEGLEEPIDRLFWAVENHKLFNLALAGKGELIEAGRFAKQSSLLLAALSVNYEITGIESDSLHEIAENEKPEIVKHPKEYVKPKRTAVWAENIRTRMGLIIETVNVSNIINPLISAFSNILLGFFAISFIAFFLLRDRRYFLNQIIPIFPPTLREPLRNLILDTRRLLSRYFGGIALQLLSIMSLISIGLLIIGLPLGLSLAIGFFAGFFNIVPYLGPLIGGSLGLIMGFTAHLDAPFYEVTFPLLIKMTVIFSIVQVLDNVIFQPVYFGRSIQAHPLEIFLVIFIGGSVAGIPGMIFAVPAYTFIRLLAIQFFKALQAFYSEKAEE
jgi:predicted PurR-regulated permease PerM